MTETILKESAAALKLAAETLEQCQVRQIDRTYLTAHINLVQGYIGLYRQQPENPGYAEKLRKSTEGLCTAIRNCRDRRTG